MFHDPVTGPDPEARWFGRCRLDPNYLNDSMVRSWPKWLDWVCKSTTRSPNWLNLSLFSTWFELMLFLCLESISLWEKWVRVSSVKCNHRCTVCLNMINYIQIINRREKNNIEFLLWKLKTKCSSKVTVSSHKTTIKRNITILLRNSSHCTKTK